MPARAEKHLCAHRQLQQAKKIPASHTKAAWSVGVRVVNKFIARLLRDGVGWVGVWIILATLARGC